MCRPMMLLTAMLFALMLTTGCSHYVDGYFYAPHPAVAEIQTAATTQPAQPSPPTLLSYATIVGVRRADRDQNLPLSIEVRMRFDNPGTQGITFDPRTLDLSNGELLRFPPAVAASQPIPLPPQSPVVVQANFPFPPGTSYDTIDLQTLQLRWQVLIDGHPVSQAASFRRVYRYYEDPYWEGRPYGYGYPYPDYYGYPRFGFGGAIIIRR